MNAVAKKWLKVNIASTVHQRAKLGISLLDCYWLVRKECRRLAGNLSGDW